MHDYAELGRREGKNRRVKHDVGAFKLFDDTSRLQTQQARGIIEDEEVRASARALISLIKQRAPQFDYHWLAHTTHVLIREILETHNG